MRTRYMWLGCMIAIILFAGCAPTYHFGVEDKAVTVPDEFGQTEVVIAAAEKSAGAKYCPDKIAKAKELAKKGVETYWACRSAEGLAMLADARKLAKEAESCRPPAAAPPPPKPVDSDGDGVYDDKDQCPNTPKGVKVNGVGCPLDSDADGVYDYLDKCPGTPTGAKVDQRGCWVLKGVYFDTGKWDVKPQYYSILDEVVSVLNKNPSVKVEIQGHTDNRGSAKYNQKLSGNRAKAVMDYLIKAGIGRDRLTAKGYGLSKPAFPNTTPENMAKNRRVQLEPTR